MLSAQFRPSEASFDLGRPPKRTEKRRDLRLERDLNALNYESTSNTWVTYYSISDLYRISCFSTVLSVLGLSVLWFSCRFLRQKNNRTSLNTWPCFIIFPPQTLFLLDPRSPAKHALCFVLRPLRQDAFLLRRMGLKVLVLRARVSWPLRHDPAPGTPEMRSMIYITTCNDYIYTKLYI